MRVILKTLIVLFIGFSFAGLLPGAIPPAERKALIAFYNSFRGDEWGRHCGWKFPPLHTDGFSKPGTEHEWFGVEIANNTVIGLHMFHNHLSGAIPPQIVNLKNLKMLNLGNNAITESLPPYLGRLAALETINFYNTNVPGPIPAEMGNLSRLKKLNLYDNRLSGPIPPQLGNLHQLEELDMGYNNLSGPIPPQLGNLANLKKLNISYTHVCGAIPAELGKLGKLEGLGLNDNRLDGTLPPELGALSNLKYLRLEGNLLTGPIPERLGDIRGLLFLNLEANFLSGAIPAHLGDLSELTLLWLGINQLSGEIPPRLAKLTKLEYLTLGHNCLTASDPALIRWLNSLSPNWNRYQCVDESTISVPTVVTFPVHSITPTSAASGGDAVSGNGAYIYEKGVCWGPNPNPTIHDNKRISDGRYGAGQGTYKCFFSGLTPNTHYYLRSYALNKAGAGYGVNTTFTTPRETFEKKPPFGSFDTPVNGAAVSGGIAVTGWALDDKEIEDVKIYRLEGRNKRVLIGSGVFIEGARPDIAAAFPDYPDNTRAGWGYLMLTNTLPNGGDGRFTLIAVVTDKAGKSTVLGNRTIIADNARAVKPFGAVDTPEQGDWIYGNRYEHFGWALTPPPNAIPRDGSSILVWVDGVSIGHPEYNLPRPDVAALFPKHLNSDGPGGHMTLSPARFAGGLHTMQWSVTDDAGNTDGVGSRYFYAPENRNAPSNDRTAPLHHDIDSLRLLPDSPEPIAIRKGFNPRAPLAPAAEDEQRRAYAVMKEMNRVEIRLAHHPAALQGYLVANGQLTPLPAGSTLDPQKGTFYWAPGPGFLGNYSLVFIIKDNNGQEFKRFIDITIEPLFNHKTPKN